MSSCLGDDVEGCPSSLGGSVGVMVGVSVGQGSGGVSPEASVILSSCSLDSADGTSLVRHDGSIGTHNEMKTIQKWASLSTPQCLSHGQASHVGSTLPSALGF